MSENSASLEFKKLVSQVENCTLCEEYLPLPAKPVFRIHPEAKILIAGQAPGKKAHQSGTPFDDRSGDRLRDWMGVTRRQFYDPEKIAFLPMGFCYPGTGKSGDLPPRPECAATWRQPLIKLINNVEITLVIGQYAHRYHFGKQTGTLTATVHDWQSYWPDEIPLPHPSPRNNLWLRRNPWFEEQLIPALRKRINSILDAS